MPRIDPDDPAVPSRDGTGYPEPYRARCLPRRAKRIGVAAGLTDFGVNLVTVPPGAWSSQRHWHEADDEALVMLSGELVLIEKEGRTTVRAGDVCAFPKGGGGHHLVNESGRDARFVVVGASKGGARYPDIDLRHDAGETFYRRKDGTPYPAS